MTVSIKLVTVTNNIAAITISGVNVLKLSEIAENAAMSCPVLQPIPNGFITDMEFELQSVGTDSSRAINLSYTLNYRYLHAPVGSGGALLSSYEGLIENLVEIVRELLSDSIYTGAVDVSLSSVSNIGAVVDPAGNQYHGVDIALRVLEFVQ